MIKIKAPAKINIGLSIVSKRSDGFHNLETIFYQIKSLYDELVFEKSGETELLIDKEITELEHDNIILKALSLLQKRTKVKLHCKIHLKKNIPIGAGLGGGSSDGAATLKALNKLFSLKISNKELREIALELGSDVPLFLYDYPTLGKSRGEILEKIKIEINHPILLVNPGIHISTKEAFTKIVPQKSNFDLSMLPNVELEKWNDYLKNDFEKNIFKLYPEIEKIKTIMLNNGALLSYMSGTGSTVYGIFKTYDTAQKVRGLFPKSYFTFIGN